MNQCRSDLAETTRQAPKQNQEELENLTEGRTPRKQKGIGVALDQSDSVAPLSARNVRSHFEDLTSTQTATIEHFRESSREGVFAKSWKETITFCLQTPPAQPGPKSNLDSCVRRQPDPQGSQR